MSSHKPVPEIYDGVSTEDVPSAGFGWSRTSRVGVQVAGWVSTFIILAYNFGNHQGDVETVWLYAIAVLLITGLLIHLFQPKLNQVRTLTARNQPEGYRELDWDYEQKTLGGPYAELTDSQLRALNIDPARVAHLRVDPAATSVAAPASKNQAL